MRHRTRTTTDELASLDVNWLKRNGFLRPGIHTLQWHDRAGNVIGQVTVAVASGIALREMKQKVSLTWTACNYGGCRPWFVCPGCGGRAGKLFAMCSRFYCRSCHSLTYETNRASRALRLMYRAQSLDRRLGGTGALDGSPRPKPKGMHWQTYESLRDRSESARRAFWLQTACTRRILGFSQKCLSPTDR